MTDILLSTKDNGLLFDMLTLKSITAQRLYFVSTFSGVHSIEPRCIKYQAGKLLEVIGGEDLGTLGGSAFTPTPLPEMLTLRSIEQW
jgi:hypothetical protein